VPESDFETQWTALLSRSSETTEQAPASLKARMYSALIHKQQETGPIRSLDATVSAGRQICVFEKLVQISPVGENAKAHFFCEICHARLLAEHFDNPPIFWAGCPYVKFKES
jgi:hypothetical protein